MPSASAPTIAVLGDRDIRHASHREADAVLPMLDAAAEWVPTDAGADLSGYDAVWLMSGSPYADDQAVLDAIAWARTHGVPFLGTCAGLQYAVLEFLRNALGRPSASHAETDGERADNAVAPLACSLYGVEREVRPVPGTRFAAIAPRPFAGMHYCNYGPTTEAVAALVDAGWVVGATGDDVAAEVLELSSHPFFVLSLFQPQIGALAGLPVHPLLSELVRAAGTAGAAEPT